MYFLFYVNKSSGCSGTVLSVYIAIILVDFMYIDNSYEISDRIPIILKLQSIYRRTQWNFLDC